MKSLSNGKHCQVNTKGDLPNDVGTYFTKSNEPLVEFDMIYFAA